MRRKLIACEVFYRECCAIVASSPHTVDAEFLPKGLHDIGCEGMSERLQASIDAASKGGCEAVLLGYGLCSRGVEGLVARTAPLVLPRAHDCITLFLGSRGRYDEYFHSHPGVYFLTSGWIERGEVGSDLKPLSTIHKLGLDGTAEEWAAQYGEDNAAYLAEVLGLSNHYGQYTYIEMGVEPDDRFEKEARRRADEKGWALEKERGDLGLLRRLVNGPWEDADFLVVPPGHRIVASHDGSIVRADPVR